MLLPSVKQLGAIAAGLLVVNATAYAWSAEGHRAVAMIAAAQLQEHANNTAVRIASILAGLKLADIAPCPDQVRGFEQSRTAMSDVCKSVFPDPPTGTAPWHFINIPVKAPTYQPSVAEVTAACNDDCVLTAIDRFTAVLKSAAPADRDIEKLKQREALSFLVHFIGDLHQPLHAADRRDDLGGNNEVVTFFGNEAKLHAVWDREAVSRIAADEATLVAVLAPNIEQAAAEPSSTPIDWTLQSYDFARDVAYAGIPDPDGNHVVAHLGQAYQDAAEPVIRMQIARAGVRLAAVLREALP